MDNELNKKQERFCREFLIDCNAGQACIRAGYSAKTAYSAGPRLLNNPRIQARIAELQAGKFEELDIEAGDVIAMLLRSYKDASASGQHGPAIRAAELLGKRLGLFIDVNRQADSEDPTPEEAIRDVCTVNGVLCEVCHGYGMKMLEAIRKAERSPPRPVSEGEKPNLTVVP